MGSYNNAWASAKIKNMRRALEQEGKITEVEDQNKSGGSKEITPRYIREM